MKCERCSKRFNVRKAQSEAFCLPCQERYLDARPWLRRIIARERQAAILRKHGMPLHFMPRG